jgi:uncharacterized protein YbaP (TraB family)
MKTILRSLAALLFALCALPAFSANYLWEVTGLKNRAYLYGTVHAGKPEWFPLPDAVERAFVESTVLVVEADVTNTTAMAAYGSSMSYAPPDSLKAHVAPEDYERFRKLLPRYRFTEEALAQAKPFIAISLLVFAEWAREGLLAGNGIDQYLILKARAEAKPVKEIEGIDMQMRLMDSLSEREQRELFASTLTAVESGLTGEQIKSLVKAWQAGDPDALLAMARKYNAQVKGAAEFEEKFIWSRHDDMVKKIEGYLNDSKERHFIAVGSLHLAGPRGLIELLRKRGYVVRQM